MSTNEEPKKQVPVPVVVAAVVALLGFVGWWGYHSLSGPKDPGQGNASVASQEERWRGLIRKSGGDMNKLTAEEKAQFMKEAGPYATRIWDSLKSK
jgi:hypothetical protein